MFNLKQNQIVFISFFDEQSSNHEWFKNFTDVVYTDLNKEMSTDDFIKLMDKCQGEIIPSITKKMGGVIPYQLFCFMQHAPVLIRKSVFDKIVNATAHYDNFKTSEDYMSYYWTPFRWKNKIYDFRKEVNYLRFYQSGCRVFIKPLTDSDVKAENIVKAMTEAYKPYYAEKYYNYDNLLDGYLTRQEVYQQNKVSATDIIDAYPIASQVLAGLAGAALVNKILK